MPATPAKATLVASRTPAALSGPFVAGAGAVVAAGGVKDVIPPVGAKVVVVELVSQVEVTVWTWARVMVLTMVMVLV